MANIDDSGPLNLSKARRKDLSVSWVFNDESEITAGSLQVKYCRVQAFNIHLLHTLFSYLNISEFGGG